MKIKLKQTTYNVQVTGHGAPTWLLLHGFMSNHHDFDQIYPRLSGTVIIPDLLGHGQTTAPVTKVFSMTQQVEDLIDLLTALKIQQPLHLVGYSMGGRIALGFAIAHPEKIVHLFLESSRPGLESKVQRTKRQAHDAKLADQLMTEPLSKFVAHWTDLPLFQSQQALPEIVKMRIKQQRLRQRPKQLAKSLRQIGTGQQPNYWPKLKSFTKPVTIITGQLDPKFTKIGQIMAEQLPHSQHISLPNLGHNTHIEAPDLFHSILIKGACKCI